MNSALEPATRLVAIGARAPHHRRADQAPCRAQGRAPGRALYRAPEARNARRVENHGVESGERRRLERHPELYTIRFTVYMRVHIMWRAGTCWYWYTYIVTLHSHWFYLGECIPKTKPRRGRSIRRASQATAKKQKAGKGAIERELKRQPCSELQMQACSSAGMAAGAAAEC